MVPGGKPWERPDVRGVTEKFTQTAMATRHIDLYRSVLQAFGTVSGVNAG